jgi:threonine dehydrogenase-like Zn-dependent dehydrogenase
MRQLVVAAPGHLTFEDAPEPEARSGEMTVRVQLAMLDSSAVDAISRPPLDRPAFAVGGAAAGVVESSAGALRAGSPVVAWPNLGCRACTSCLAKADGCERPRRMGIDAPGTLAERISVRRPNIVRAPALLSPVVAVAATAYADAWSLVAALPELSGSSRVLLLGEGAVADQVMELVHHQSATVIRPGEGTAGQKISHAVVVSGPIGVAMEAVSPGGTVVVTAPAGAVEPLDLGHMVANRLNLVARGPGGPNAYRDLLAWMVRTSFTPDVPEVVAADDVVGRAIESPGAVMMRSRGQTDAS